MRILAQIHTSMSAYPAKGGEATSGGNEPNKGGTYGDKLPGGGEDRTNMGGR